MVVKILSNIKIIINNRKSEFVSFGCCFIHIQQKVFIYNSFFIQLNEYGRLALNLNKFSSFK